MRPDRTPSGSRAPGSGLRARKYGQARRALFDAAMELFRDKGFDETSAEEIADRAGFSRATFFNHFGSKAAVLRHYGESLQEKLEQLLAEADPGRPPLDRARDVLHAMASEAEARRDEVRLLLSFSLRDPDYLVRPTAARRRVLGMVESLVAEAQRRGEARRDMSARELAAHLLGVYQVALVAIVFERRAARAAIEAGWRFALGGIRGGHPDAG